MPDPVIRTPSPALAEMTSRAPAVVPPMVFPVAPDRISTPWALATAVVPFWPSPMRSAETTLFDEALIQTPA